MRGGWSKSKDVIRKLLPKKKSAGRAGQVAGDAYEAYLRKKLGASDAFSKGERQFDGALGNSWLEIKNRDWTKMSDKVLESFKSSAGSQKRIANDNGATFEVISKQPIPAEVKNWLKKKGINYIEGI